MKKLVGLMLVSALFVANTINAQFITGNSESKIENTKDFNDDNDRRIWKKRSKYFTFGYVSQNLTSSEFKGLKYTSDYGFNLNWGKTWYLNKKPIANMIKFGIDFTWMDLNYVKYNDMAKDLDEAWNDAWDYANDYGYGNDYGDNSYYYGEEDEDFSLGCHQLEYGMQVGVSATINPVQDLKIATYVRFQPSYSLLLLDDEVYYGFAPLWNFGVSASWKALTFGVEGRWGTAKYNGISIDEEGDYDFDYENPGDYSISDDILETFSERMKIKTFRVYVGFRF